MIRERRAEDIDRLCAVLNEVDLRGSGAARSLNGSNFLGWLVDVDAERSWVFDQAPVSAAPTRNVVGHVQIYRPVGAPWMHELAVATSRRADDLMVIGRLFVKPGKHDAGIARYLLSESVNFVERQGCAPVLDPGDLGLVPARLVQRLGFVEIPSGAGRPVARIRTR